MKPGHIYYNSETPLLAALCLNTERAFKKGRINQHYPVKIHGKEYADADLAYIEEKKTWPLGKIRYQLMTDILTKKLHQNYSLVNGLTEQGGDDFLKKCFAYIDLAEWWGSRDSEGQFMLALRTAYRLNHAIDDGRLWCLYLEHANPIECMIDKDLRGYLKRYSAFAYNNKVTILEQNPNRKSEWAEKAREGKSVAQLFLNGKYHGVYVDGEFTRY